MTEKQQNTSAHTQEKMARRYDDGREHKHNKDHLEYERGRKSHPATQHGGDPEGHKHPHKSRAGKGHSDNGHHRTKMHDHKEHTREHHKKDVH
ncbi:hypothetical protein [Pseudovibrio brasiliensis]|uniref:Cation diffusion facilitator family transporter n=1 Tax=Pseudovibrio brasiliensis TaxID=1898042 RepID=A0ABX8AL34_9HYPH|nr:hypothetical protein [Pseudovibrio brasiliensis]QUS54610.1 hypothetical protein KGB56_14570 [Pseudovibrio brasiliensis]